MTFKSNLATDDELERSAQHPITIMIVDDEQSIRRTLEGVFRDEGYQTLVAQNADEAFKLLENFKPDLLILDIWMPGMDGIAALQRIKELYPDLAVIMVSGHATIATAMQATRLGAVDFVEKPLDLELLLSMTKRAVRGDRKKQFVENVDSTGVAPSDSSDLSNKSKLGVQTGAALNAKIKSIVFDQINLLKGNSRPQKTLSHSALLYGQGLHTGKKSGLILEPLPPNSGIHFAAVAESEIVPAHFDFVESTGFATTLKLGATQAGTIEHLMSALAAYGVTNLLVKCNGEVPVMDGSALEFCSLFEEIGFDQQDAQWYDIKIDKTFEVARENEFIRVEPADHFIIDYTLDYPAPLGKQQMTFELHQPSDYRTEIAPARTFGLVKDIEWLQKQGLALGGRFDNFVLFGDSGPINTKLRFPDEPVRHKILDAIGDLFLLGRLIQGKVTASMTGHSDNIALLGELRNYMRGLA